MRPAWIAALVAFWVRLYTRGLPAPIARRRIEEIHADLHDHVEHERAAGTGERRIALGIASRLLRGLGADLAWRGRQATVHRSVLRVALGVALVLSLPAAAMLITDGVVWSLADFVLAGGLLTTIGVVLELSVRKAGNLAVAIAVAALGVAAGVLGEADDAPGLVLLGILLVVSAVALGVRRARHHQA
jgi:hypothetical protein